MPQLKISQGGLAPVLSWPLFAQDFKLYSSGVVPAVKWNSVATSYSTNLTGVFAIPSPGSNAVFFRLKR
jgi:hypothetical protein